MSLPVSAPALVAAATAAKAAGWPGSMSWTFAYLWDPAKAKTDLLVSYLRVLHEDALASYVKARGASKILDPLVVDAVRKIGYSASTVAEVRASAEILAFYLAERLFPFDGRTDAQAGYALKFVNEQGPRFVKLAEQAATTAPRQRIEKPPMAPMPPKQSTASVQKKASYGWLAAAAAGIAALLVVRAVVR